MIVHNLTDQSPPHRPVRKPKDFKYAGRTIKPGDSGEIPDHLIKISDIAGWVTSMSVSIDGIPSWYKIAREKQLGIELMNSEPSEPVDEEEAGEEAE